MSLALEIELESQKKTFHVWMQGAKLKKLMS